MHGNAFLPVLDMAGTQEGALLRIPPECGVE